MPLPASRASEPPAATPATAATLAPADHSAPSPLPLPSTPVLVDLLERDDRLAFERGRLRFRLALLAGPLLLLLSYGPVALETAALTCAVILLSTAAIVVLLQRYPQTLLRHQLWLRVVDVASIFAVLASARLLTGPNAASAEFFDVIYVLTVISATGTHGLRGTAVASAAATIAVAAERWLDAQRTGIPLTPAVLFSVLFYGVLFAICGSMVGHLMRTSGAVVARRDRAWEAQLQERNAALETAALQLTQSNKELEAFAYSVSHDLRAPLRSIDGFSRIVQDRYADQIDDVGRDYLRRVRAASQRMGQLIDDLLALSRLARTELRREPLDLTALAHAVADELRARHPERDVTLHVHDGMHAVGDPSLVRAVLENVLGNAWKFTATRDQARIEVGTLGPMVGRTALGAPERRAQPRLDGQTVFYVQDNGAGFDMAYADKLFGPFQRLHTASEFEGTGIGLATVQRIIRRHRGWVWAKGELDRGATFYFTLPTE